MKKKIHAIILLLSLSCCVHAQKVWTEGTSWEIVYKDGTPSLIQTLEAPVVLDGKEYLPLTERYAGSEEKTTVAYVRCEGDDEMVYVRYVNPNTGVIDDETVLYDFATWFEYGATIRYGMVDGSSKEVFLDPTDGDIIYYYGVLEEGDIIPEYNGLAYKLGYMGGVLNLFLGRDVIYSLDGDAGEESQPTGGNSGPKPKPTNVSHTIFKPNGCQGIVYSSLPKVSVEQNHTYYNINGTLSTMPNHGIIIINNKKVLK